MSAAGIATIDPVTAREGRKRYGVLLVAILTAFLIQGIADPSRWEQLVVAVLLGFTLIAALVAAETRPTFMRVACVVVGLVIAAAAVAAALDEIDVTATRLANALLVVLAPPAIVIGVLRNLRARQQVTIEAVFGVLALYLLIGMLFAYLYGAIDHIGSGTFFAGGESATVARCLYYSFTTLTTVGYGDLTAASNLGHTLSVLEGLVGQVYLVTVVSVLVSNIGGRVRPRPPA